MPKLTLFYIPCKDEAETSHLSKLLLENKLVACTNSMPIKSCYLWEGNTKNDSEQILIIKTLPEKAKEVTHFVEEHHSYDTPCITFWKVQVNESYFEWAKNQL